MNERSSSLLEVSADKLNLGRSFKKCAFLQGCNPSQSIEIEVTIPAEGHPYAGAVDDRRSVKKIRLSRVEKIAVEEQADSVIANRGGKEAYQGRRDFPTGHQRQKTESSSYR